MYQLEKLTNTLNKIKPPYCFIVHTNKNDIIATVNYGKEIVAAVCKENILGVQFHPEKSQEQGQKLIHDFLNWAPT